MTSLAVFDTPSPPDGWEGREVIRIVDPLGKAAAWIDPMFAGICVGFYVREHQSERWLTALSSMPPDDIDRWGAVGCELLWLHQPGREPIPARSMGSGWTFETRDPTSVTVSGEIDRYQVQVTYRCEDGVLVIDAGITSQEPVRGALGLRIHTGDAQVINDGGGLVSLVGDFLPAGMLRCSTGPAMHVRWEQTVTPAPVTRVDSVPGSSGWESDDLDLTYGWSLEAAFE